MAHLHEYSLLTCCPRKLDIENISNRLLYVDCLKSCSFAYYRLNIVLEFDHLHVCFCVNRVQVLFQMGAPKQKWTSEEEAALKAGIAKHGAGKWRTILKDPEFSAVLCLRSNVDLKVYL